MADRPISIVIRGPVPSKVICPSCSSEVTVPSNLDNSKIMYQFILNCTCGKLISLRCFTHGN